MRHLIDPLDFTLEETTKVLDLADRIAESPEIWMTSLPMLRKKLW